MIKKKLPKAKVSAEIYSDTLTLIKGVTQKKTKTDFLKSFKYLLFAEDYKMQTAQTLILVGVNVCAAFIKFIQILFLIH